MEPCEYAQTAAVEDQHWWFRTLRAIWRGLLDAASRDGAVGPRTLDAGCGTGGNLRALEREREAFGLDLSPLALTLARSRVASPLVRGSVSSLPFRDHTFDLVLCTDLLYHRDVADDRAALVELRRVLRPGGWLLVNVPAFASLRSAHDRAMHTARRYRRNELRNLLRDNGFQIVQVAYWNGILFLPAVLLRWIRRGRGNRSEIVRLPEPINAILTAVGRLDAALAMRGLLPAGLSVAALARRDDSCVPG